MKPEVDFQVKCLVPLRCRGSFIAALAMLFFAIAASAASPRPEESRTDQERGAASPDAAASTHGVIRREITEESFAAAAAEMAVERVASGLTTSIEFAPGRRGSCGW